MKVFAAVLVLAVVSGCQARVIALSDVSEAWADTLSYVEDSLSGVNLKVDRMMDISGSEMITELDRLVQEVSSELLRYKEDLLTGGVPYAEEATRRLTRDLRWLGDRLREHLKNTSQQVDKYSQELQAIVDQTLVEVRARMVTYSRKLKKRLSRDLAEMGRQVSTYLEEIQSRSYDHMEDARSRVEPYLARVQDNIQGKITTLTDMVGSPMEQMKDSIQTTGEGVKRWMEDTSDGAMTSLQLMIRDLDGWFQPYFSMISDNL